MSDPDPIANRLFSRQRTDLRPSRDNLSEFDQVVQVMCDAMRRSHGSSVCELCDQPCDDPAAIAAANTALAMGGKLLQNDLPPAHPDCYVPQRDRAIVVPILEEVLAEIARRQAESHMLHGGTYETEVHWLMSNFDGVDRAAVINTIATLVSNVGIMDFTKRKHDEKP